MEKPSLSEDKRWDEENDSFNWQVEEMRLTREDLRKRILDVGSNWGNFANQAKKHGYTDVYSVDLVHPHDRYEVDTEVEWGAGKLAVGNVMSLPYKDEAFDLVVSFCSMPNVLHLAERMRNRDTFRKRTTDAIREMLRVVKIGGEVRLGRVVNTRSDEKTGLLYSRWEETRHVLDDLEAEGRAIVSVEQIDQPNLTDASGDAYISTLVRLEKLPEFKK